VKRALLAIPALLALGCASAPNIQTNRDANVPLPANPTWAWGARDTVSHYETDPAAQNPILHQRVVSALQKALAKKGWQQVASPADANVIVTYHIGVKRTVAMESTTMGAAVYGGYGGYGWGYYGAPTYVTTTTTPVGYTTGALLVYVRDKTSGAVAWSGLYTKDVTDPMQSTDEGVQTGVNDLLRDLK